MSVTSLEGVLVVLFLVLPGAAAGSAMRYWTGYPQEPGSFEPVVKSVARSLFGLAVVELINTGVTADAFGDFLISPVLSAGSLVNVSGQALTHYAIYFSATVALSVALRSLLMTQNLEVIVGKRTVVVPPLYKLRSYFPPEADADAGEGLRPSSGRRRSPRVRVGLKAGGEPIEGWLVWSSDGTEAESALIIRDVASYSAMLIHLDSISWLRVVDLRYEVEGSATATPLSKEE